MIRGSGNSPYNVTVNRTYSPAQPQATTDGAAQQTVQVQSTSTPAMQTLGGIWEKVKTTFMNFWNAAVKFVSGLFGAKPVETIDAESAQIAKAYNLLPTKDNVQAFLAEVRQYEANGTLGPDSKDTDSIKELQTVFKQMGYAVDVTGKYDEKTCGAVIRFKRENNLHQNYRLADGTWGVNEYLDSQTMAALQQKLSATTPTTSTSPTTPTTSTTPTTPTTTDPGVTDYTAIAKQYGLQNTRENVQAFLAELQAYEKEGALGPGINAPNDVKELQEILKSFGYQVSVNGMFDQATGNAVVAFKKANGLRQNYRMADGAWAVNEYANQETLKKMVEKAEAMQPPTQPTQPQGSLDEQAIAKQYNLLSTSENVQAFLAEVATYENNGALGPGATATGDIKELQGILKGWGYAVDETGTYDQKTGDAITRFKKENNLHQTYKTSDGQWAINEYADQPTLKKIMEKLG